MAVRPDKIRAVGNFTFSQECICHYPYLQFHFLPFFLPFSHRFIFSQICCHSWIRESHWCNSSIIAVSHCFNGNTQSTVIVLFLPLLVKTLYCSSFLSSSYSAMLALRLKEEREKCSVKGRSSSCTELQCQFLNTTKEKHTLLPHASVSNILLSSPSFSSTLKHLWRKKVLYFGSSSTHYCLPCSLVLTRRESRAAFSLFKVIKASDRPINRAIMWHFG